MNETAPGKMQIIKVVDPLLCVRCNNAYIADVVCDEEERRKMFYCSRRDCDNWVYTSSSTRSEALSDEAA